jgi:hypothetical protein
LSERNVDSKSPERFVPFRAFCVDFINKNDYNKNIGYVAKKSMTEEKEHENNFGNLLWQF